MSRFNLTFKGEVVKGHDPQRVREVFSTLFSPDAPARVERFFTGAPITLRRDLERKEAAELYASFKSLGAVVYLENMSTEETGNTHSSTDSSIGQAQPEAVAAASARAREERAAERARQRAQQQAERERKRKLREQKLLEKAAQDSLRKEQRAQQAAQRAREKEQQRAAALEEREQRKAQERQRAAELALRTKLAKEAEKAERERDATALRLKLAKDKQQAQAEANRRKEALVAAKEEQARISARQLSQDKAARVQVVEAALKEQLLRANSQRERNPEGADTAPPAPGHPTEWQPESAASTTQPENPDTAQQSAWANGRASKTVGKSKAKGSASAAIITEGTTEATTKPEANTKAKAGTKTKAKAGTKAKAKAKSGAKIKAGTKAKAGTEAKAGTKTRAKTKTKAGTKANPKSGPKTRDNAKGKTSAKASVKPTPPAAMGAAQNQAPTDEAEAPAPDVSKLEPGHKIQAKAPSRPSAVPDARPHTKKTRPPLRRQRGAPNTFKLRPFRETRALRERSQKSRQLCKAALAAALISGLALLLLTVRFLTLPPAPTVYGAQLIAANGNGDLLIGAQDRLLLHNRAGKGTLSPSFDDLGLKAVQEPIEFLDDDQILVSATVAGAVPDESGEPWQLMRCELVEPSCEAFAKSALSGNTDDLAVDPRTNEVYVAHRASQRLLKFAADGTLLAARDVHIPVNVSLTLQSGLLHMSRQGAPAIGIFRPDTKGFGEQLDEVLLLPPGDTGAEQGRVTDFIAVGDQWWVTLVDPTTSIANVYRFDSQWAYLDRVPMATGSYPQQLLNWQKKVLIRDETRVPLQRFNDEGLAEVPLVSDTLETWVNQETQAIERSISLWHACLVLLSMIVATCLALAALHHLRALVYKRSIAGSASSMDGKDKAITWLDPEPARIPRLKKAGSVYLLTALVTLLIAVVMGNTATSVLALMLFLSGPAIALMIIAKGNIGHIGLLGDELVLVDHDSLYHHGSGAAIQFRNDFLMIGDVTVYAGTARLPVFTRQALQQQIAPLAAKGIRVDRKTVMVKLLQARHPLARGALACLLTSAAALALVLLA